MKLSDVIDDKRVEEASATINGLKYAYLKGVPADQKYKGTVFLIHGWPDLPVGWRNQIPLFLDMGFRVIVPAMMAYAGTAAPHDLSRYTHKSAAEDIRGLAQHLGLKQIILGGHDWGGAIVWRTVLYEPGLVSHVFSVCTPYLPPTKHYVSLQEMVKTKLPNFGYQLQLSGTEVENYVKGLEKMKQFLRGMYGGRGPNGEAGYSPTKGVLIENLPKLGPSPLMKPNVLDYYAERYIENGIGPTCNWYRSYELKCQEDAHLEEIKIKIPSLFIAAANDAVLTLEMGAGMPALMPNLIVKQVAANHWALWEKPKEVNDILKEWFENVVFKDISHL